MDTEETGAARAVALLGTLAAVFLLIAFMGLGGDTPDTEDGAAKILRFYSDHSTQQEVAAYLVALAGVGLLFFGASLRQRLTATSQARSVWVSVASAGTTVAAAGMMVAGGMHFSLASETKHLTAPGAAALNSLDGAALFAVFGGLSVALAATVFATWHARLLPRGFLVPALLFAVISITPVGFIGGLLAILWIGALGIYLALRPVVSPAGSAAATGSAPPARLPATG